MSSRPQKQSMSELKFRRLVEHNQRLKEDLARPRIRVSEASSSLIRYCKTTKDSLHMDRGMGARELDMEDAEGSLCVYALLGSRIESSPGDFYSPFLLHVPAFFGP
ncbi:hypothetical protein NLI96_g5526 [Meripilus lineatus]|uniref:Guanine nucleotide-binding protein subunit gamma n=1 Tax=Meripilus lineatus TaxID=2056292 RepID=A0AAD5V4X4_9APHY|nr:hypothetical protein NLI96_g5526 [Physisporinus lineatus]